MWRSKMAARWRRNDGNLNAGNSIFPSTNNASEADTWSKCTVVTAECLMCVTVRQDERSAWSGPSGDSEPVLSRHGVDGVEMDTQSCMDHSILAIFEDSNVASESKRGVEEESETLLSALNEILDSVEYDDKTLSPFDSLPDTKLLTHPEHRDDSVELSLAERLRPRSKSPVVSVTVKNDGEKEVKSKTERKSPPHPYKKQSQALFPSKNKKEAEVEVFTSTSLVNLVKIMHSYCLKLHVEEKGDEMSRNHTLFSQEEVWKYERPSEESDEEINVVSDDEGTVMETKEEKEGDRESDNSKVLKSVLVNGSTSREKKKVSFGPVQVASFNESLEKGLNGKNSGHTSKSVSVQLNSTKALKDLARSAPEPQIMPSEMNSNKTKPLPPKGETKAKSLSLQQYRQLRQKRQPLVEKQGNYTTKWPSLSEPPKELTPIFCLQGQRQNSCIPKTIYNYLEGRRGGADQLHRSQTPGYKTHRNSAAPRPPPSDATPSTPLLHTGAKLPRTESKIIPSAGLQPGIVAHVNITEPGSKKSPVKKPTLLSSDPPNPVLLPLSVSQTSPPSTDHCSTESNMEIFNRGSNLDSTMHFQEVQNESSGTSLQQQPSSLGLKPEELSVNQDCTPLFQEINFEFRNIASGVSSGSPALFPTSTQNESSSQPQKCSMILAKEAKLEPKTPLSQSPETSGQTMCPSSSPHLSQLFAPEPQETLPYVLPSTSLPEEPLQSGFRGQSSTSDSGIEASDLTSLLEQFEETQAKEKRVEPKLVSSTSPSSQTDGHLDRTESAGTEGSTTIPLTFLVEPPKPLSTSESRGTQEILRNLQHLQMSEGVNIPEPLGTDIVLSTQQDLPARRKNPPSKAIQIIEARPLPSKKTHSNLSEFPVALSSPHIHSSISSDHDYCEPADRSLTSITQSSRACNSQEFSETMDDLQVISYESSAASECRKQTLSTEVNPTTRAVDNSAKSVTQHLCEGPRSRSETASSADRVLSLSDSTAPEQECGFAAKEKTAPCALPTPPPSPPVRGRDRRRDQRRSPRSDSSSSSCSSLSSSSSSSSASHSPKRQKRHHKRSESRSCSLSPPRSISHSPPQHYRWSYSRSRCSRSRSRSWSQSRSPSRSRSPSPQICRRQWRNAHSRESRRLRREHEIRIQKLKAIDERRVVYVGRICRSMTHNELRERFSQFGEVECVSLHFRERGDHYGFVTFYDMNDAFAAIDNGSKLRRPDELPFDLCFGGRRQFCNSDYADLDANRDADSSPAKSRFEELDFDQLLKQAQRGLKS